MRHRFRLVERLGGQARFGVGDFGGGFRGTMCSRTRGVGWARSGPGSPSISAEPPRAVRRVRGGGRAGLGPCPCRRDLCACSRAAVVGTSYTLGVSICSSCSARARCFLASTRLPTRRYVCPTCRSCAAACEHAPTPQSPSASKAQVIVRRQGCGRVTGGRRAGGDSCSGRWLVRLTVNEGSGRGDAPAVVSPRCPAAWC